MSNKILQSQGLSDQGSIGGRQQLTQTHSVFTLPLTQGGGHHSSEGNRCTAFEQSYYSIHL